MLSASQVQPCGPQDHPLGSSEGWIKPLGYFGHFLLGCHLSKLRPSQTRDQHLSGPVRISIVLSKPLTRSKTITSSVHLCSYVYQWGRYFVFSGVAGILTSERPHPAFYQTESKGTCSVSMALTECKWFRRQFP